MEADFSNGWKKGWRAGCGAVAGAKNRSRRLPCQDGVFASVSPRPFLILMDGRGSSPRSQHGVAGALLAIRNAVRRLEPQAAIALDNGSEWPARVAWRGVAQMIYAAAADAQDRAAADLGCEPRDMEFTLAFCAIGRGRAGWCAIGDSPVYLLKSGRLGVVHNGRTGKGEEEFANQTRFVSARARSLEGFHAGLTGAEGVEGFLAASDGAAVRLENLAAHLPAEAVRQIIGSFTGEEPPSRGALRRLLREAAWERVTSDDRSVAVLARAPGADAAEDKTGTEEAAEADRLPEGSRRDAGAAEGGGQMRGWRTAGREPQADAGG